MTDDVPTDRASGRLGKRSVVLLRDATMPATRGVASWRQSVHASFTELGLSVHDLAWRPLTEPAKSTHGAADHVSGQTAPGAGTSLGPSGTATAAAYSPRLGPLTPRRIAAGLNRRARRLVRRNIYPVVRRVPVVARYGRRALYKIRPPAGPPASARSSSVPQVDPRLAELDDVDVLLAESPAGAQAAAAAGIPRPRIWLLAVPIERSAAGEPVPWAEDLRAAIGSVGGVLVDTLDAAAVIERVAAPTQVVVFPPLARDRAYVTLASTPSTDGTDGTDGTASIEGTAATTEAAGQVAPSVADLDPFPADLVGHLDLWWGLLCADHERGAVEPTAYSWSVERFRGGAGPWNEPEYDTWGGTARPGEGEPEPWTAEAQRTGLQRLVELLPGRATAGAVTADNAHPPSSADSVSAVSADDAVRGDGDADAKEPPVDVRRVGVFGYDLKFARDLATCLDAREDLDVTVDEWPAAGRRNEGVTEPLARSAHTLVAEWARPNAVWLAENKRPDQLLVVRLHRFEIETEHPRRLDIDAVDAVVTIAPLMGRRIQTELGWPREKLIYVPNYVDVRRLDRPKYAGARFTLGMVSIVPGLKRFDLALDLLRELRQVDPRFSLLVRSATPWTHKPSWQDPAERRRAQLATERIEKDPLLRGAVVMDAFGKDMAAWYRKVGHILSLSDLEGSHTALSEGMASGAVPVLRGWSGADEIYGDHWVRASVSEAAEEVLAAADPDVWETRSAQARKDAAERFNPDEVVAAWGEVVCGRFDDARARFGAYANLEL